MQQSLFKIIFVIFFSFGSIPLFAQLSVIQKIDTAAYGSQYPLAVGTNKTTILIFPFKIVAGGVDLGSADIMASPMNNVTNILRLKAVKEKFPPTNVTVVTTDGKVYSFYIFFSDYPDERPIVVAKLGQMTSTQAILLDHTLNDKQIEDALLNIQTEHSFLKRPLVKSYGIELSLKGIYSKEDVLFFMLALKNDSPIDYTTDFGSFYIRDQKQMKRTAVQEKALLPLRTYRETSAPLRPGQTQTLLLAFKHFTIADHKNMVLQLFEKDGDRHLELKIKGKILMKARPI